MHSSELTALEALQQTRAYFAELTPCAAPLADHLVGVCTAGRMLDMHHALATGELTPEDAGHLFRMELIAARHGALPVLDALIAAARAG